MMTKFLLDFEVFHHEIIWLNSLYMAPCFNGKNLFLKLFDDL